MTNPRWEPAFRDVHLGASQAGEALNLSPHGKSVDLWQRFKGLVPWEESNEALDLGNDLEDGVARSASRRLGKESFGVPTLTHPSTPWLCATPDRVLSDGTLLQVKTSGLAFFQSQEMRERWGEAGTDQVPLHILVQVQIEMHVARAAWDRGDCMHFVLGRRALADDFPLPEACVVAALLAGRGCVLYRVPYEPSVADNLVYRAEKFWDLVQTSTPPEADGSDAYTEYLKRRYDSVRPDVWVEGEEAERIAQEWDGAKAALESAETRMEAVKQRAMMEIGHASGLRGTWGKLPWAERAGRKGLRESELRGKLQTDFGLTLADADAFLQRCTLPGAPHRALGPLRPSKEK